MNLTDLMVDDDIKTTALCLQSRVINNKEINTF